MDFRAVKADEIECRVGAVSKEGKGFSLLLYKDARTDMNILDETVGAMNWKKHYDLIDGQLFCTIEIWDEDKKMWIGKQDVGIESNTEAEKGRASDAQKRSGFAWGIGRELYSAPFIWITDGDPKKDRFAVDSITIENKKITALSIKNAKTGDIVYTFGKTGAKKTAAKKTTPKNAAEPQAEVQESPKTVAETAPKKPSYPHRNEFLAFCKENELDVAEICKEKNLTKASLDVDFIEALSYAVKLVALRDAQETGVSLPFEI